MPRVPSQLGQQHDTQGRCANAERPSAEDGGATPDLVRVLRLLETRWPGCTDYGPDSAPFLIGCRGDSLLREAEHFATLEARRR